MQRQNAELSQDAEHCKCSQCLSVQFLQDSRQVLTCLPLKHLRECCLDPSPRKKSTDRHQTPGQHRPGQHKHCSGVPGVNLSDKQPRAFTCCPLSRLAENNPLDACLEDDAASDNPYLVVLRGDMIDEAAQRQNASSPDLYLQKVPATRVPARLTPSSISL